MHFTINNLKKIKNQLKELNHEEFISLPNIIAVSKTFSMEKILPLVEYGHIHFGENKIQESLDKWPKIKEKFPQIKLHMIGKIQSNKAKHVLPLFDYIHSLDNLKLASIISNLQIKNNFKPKIFIQINIGNEIQKSGIRVDELELFYKECVNKLQLNIVGFMCLPPLNEKPTKYFNLMKDLREIYNLNDLSMGMSEDYIEALKFNSTYLRIGSNIFGKRD